VVFRRMGNRVMTYVPTTISKRWNSLFCYTLLPWAFDVAETLN
jgi:hypothetical protein